LAPIYGPRGVNASWLAGDKWAETSTFAANSAELAALLRPLF
jgi:hypothetical protein